MNGLFHGRFQEVKPKKAFTALGINSYVPVYEKKEWSIGQKKQHSFI